MLDTWQALRFEGIKKGRTSPLLVGCERQPNPNQTIRDVFLVKAIGLPEISDFNLAQECAGGVVAAACGLNVPPVALIEFTPDFVAGTAGDLLRFGLHAEAGLAVGSRYLQGLAPVNRNPSLRDDEIIVAARIYALDLAIQNPDRRPSNPNCGYHHRELTAYDFEAAFSFRMLIGPKPDSCAVSTFGIHEGHLFFEVLKGKPINWTPICEAITGVDPGLLMDLRDQVPATWVGVIDDVVNHFDSIRGRADDLEDEIRRSLE